jgi:non-homologous end joining protein Ku
LFHSHILETAVTEDEFKEQLHELNHKINFAKEQAFRDARAVGDVKDILEKLKVKVSQRKKNTRTKNFF